MKYLDQFLAGYREKARALPEDQRVHDRHERDPRKDVQDHDRRVAREEALADQRHNQEVVEELQPHKKVVS